MGIESLTAPKLGSGTDGVAGAPQDPVINRAERAPAQATVSASAANPDLPPRRRTVPNNGTTKEALPHPTGGVNIAGGSTVTGNNGPVTRITPAAQTIIESLHGRVEPNQLYLPRLPIPFFGTATRIEGEVVSPNVVRLDVHVGAEAPLEITLDATKRTFVARIEDATAEGPIYYRVQDLLKTENGSLVPALPFVAERPVILAQAGDLKGLFGNASEVQWDAEGRYFTAEQFGTIGVTLGGISFVDEGQALQLARDLPVDLPGYDDTTYMTAVRNNELSHMVWGRLAMAASQRSETELVTVLTDAARGNYFNNFDLGVSGLRVETNKQVNEFISDAASIGTDPRDVLRVLEYNRNLEYQPGYRLSAQFARHALTDALGNRGVAPERVDNFFHRLASNDVKMADIVTEFSLTPQVFQDIQIAYKDLGTRLGTHFASQLRARFPQR